MVRISEGCHYNGPMKVQETHTSVEHLRASLQREFVARCKKNPAYSLRAFAKYLHIDQSLLSKILRGQVTPSKATASKLGLKLGLRPSQTRDASSENFLELVDDEFQVISDWYHFAILELSKTKTFKANEKYIARRLGLHVEEVRAAIGRLRRLGIIRFENGTWSLNSRNNTWSSTQTTNEAKRLLQKNILERSLQAIDMVPFDKRDNGSVTIAIRKDRLPEFKQKLQEVRRNLGEYFQTDSEFDDVYQLSIAFFPLTNETGD